MPTIGIKRDLLYAALGKTYTDDEMRDLLFKFGLELDEVTTEKQMIAKEQGETNESAIGASEDIIFRIDIPANRYDLLCLEGLVNGLLVFTEQKSQPIFKKIQPTTPEMLSTTRSTSCIRPYLVAAVLRNITFTQDSYNSFIDLQDKLHQNICRKRTLVAIGTHDLDTVKGPFVYDAKPPKEIKFKPLNQDKEYDGEEIVKLYENHAQLKQYLRIIKDLPAYPVITDSNGVVLSMPPIINSDHSKITLNTKNVIIECTATDFRKAKIVLDILVCMFSGYCENKHTVEVCIVERYGDFPAHFPELKYRNQIINVQKANSCIGINESAEKLCTLLSKMCLPAEKVRNDKELLVSIPPTRHDVIHRCDIHEDIAIAYGYNNIQKTVPKCSTIGSQNPLNKLSDMLRLAIAQESFTEALTFILCSKDDISTKLGYDIETVEAVFVANPKSLEFQVTRTTLLPGLLKTLLANKKMPLPLRLFEVSDVVFLDPTKEVGARNERHLCAVNYNTTAGFEIVHGLLDRVMQILTIPWDVKRRGHGYYLKKTEDPAFFQGRCAEVVFNDYVIGKIGVLHPQVLSNFELTNPCSYLEINIQFFA